VSAALAGPNGLPAFYSPRKRAILPRYPSPVAVSKTQQGAGYRVGPGMAGKETLHEALRMHFPRRNGAQMYIAPVTDG